MSIYDKLATIIENTPKVYEAGYNVSQNKPYIDTSKIKLFSYLCYSNRLSDEDIAKIDTSNGINFSRMFYGCTSLKTISELNVSNGLYFDECFSGCTALTTINQLDMSKAVNVNAMFYNCSALENITLVGTLNPNQTLNFGYSKLLTVDSILSIFNALVDLTGSTAKTITLGSTNLAKLTDEQKAIATNKNWNLA